VRPSIAPARHRAERSIGVSPSAAVPKLDQFAAVQRVLRSMERARQRQLSEACPQSAPFHGVRARRLSRIIAAAGTKNANAGRFDGLVVAGELSAECESVEGPRDVPALGLHGKTLRPILRLDDLDSDDACRAGALTLQGAGGQAAGGDGHSWRKARRSTRRRDCMQACGGDGGNPPAAVHICAPVARAPDDPLRRIEVTFYRHADAPETQCPGTKAAACRPSLAPDPFPVVHRAGPGEVLGRAGLR